MNIEQAREIAAWLHKGAAIANERNIDRDFALIAKAAGNTIDSLIEEVTALKTDLDEQYRVNSMGSEREYVSLGQVEAQRKVLEQALKFIDANADGADERELAAAIQEQLK